jgi:CheY-like chemotaxis protein
VHCFQVVRILRGHHSLLPSCIIIGCSANAQKYANAFLEAGADAVWKKPLPADAQIITELCKYLALRE